MGEIMLPSDALGVVLNSLKLEPYTHISVRRKGKNGVEYLGGGYSHTYVFHRRFDGLEVVESKIIDNVLCIYVR